MNTITIQQRHCRACGHSWLPRKLDRPIKCPRCQSFTWDQEQPSKEPAKEEPRVRLSA